MNSSWEYKLQTLFDVLDDDKLRHAEGQLKSLGALGWELVGILTTHSDRFVAVLKRKTAEQL